MCGSRYYFLTFADGGTKVQTSNLPRDLRWQAAKPGNQTKCFEIGLLKDEYKEATSQEVAHKKCQMRNWSGKRRDDRRRGAAVGLGRQW